MHVLSIFLTAAAVLSASVCARPSIQSGGSAIFVRSAGSRDSMLVRRNDLPAYTAAHETAAGHLETAHQAHVTAATAHRDAAKAHIGAYAKHAEKYMENSEQNPHSLVAAGHHKDSMSQHLREAESHDAQAKTLKDLADSHKGSAENARTHGLPADHAAQHQVALASSTLAQQSHQHAIASGASAHASAQLAHQSASR